MTTLSSNRNGVPSAEPPLEGPVADDREPTYHNPVWLIECAWSRLRLPALQQRVDQTIAALRDRDADHADDALESDSEGRDPVADALEACVAELREACGMGGAEAELARYGGVIRGYKVEQSTAWQAAFAAALLQHRHAASRLLEASLSVQP
jgi:hypothetical protein